MSARASKKDADAVPAPSPRRAPAKTLEARENQLIALAYDVAEDQMRKGTARSQVITEFLKRGSTKERLEKEILAEQKILLSAKTKALESQQTSEELYKKALSAMRKYTGNGSDDEYED
jgi:hypothetical protein